MTGPVQLRLALDTDPEARLESGVTQLESLRRPLRLLLDIARRQVPAGRESAAALRDGAAVLLDAGVGGRLGFVVRGCVERPPRVPAEWEQLAAELAFALSLFEGPAGGG